MEDATMTNTTEVRTETVVEQNIASMVHELTNRASTTLIGRDGNNLVISMTGGEEVIVESFFIAFTEAEFHEMQAGIYGQEEVIEVADESVYASDDTDDDIDDVEMASDAGAGVGIGAVGAGVLGLAALAAAGGGGGGGSSSSDDDDDDAADEAPEVVALMAEIEEPADGDAEMVAPEEVTEDDLPPEDDAEVAELIDESEAGGAPTDVFIGGEDTSYASALMASEDVSWDDLSAQADII